MCTVSFVPTAAGALITSNRDEHEARPPALPPMQHTLSNGTTALFPKDPLGIGSWLGVTPSGQTIVLLNGGLVAHSPRPSYRRSRGLVLLDCLSEDDAVQAFSNLDLAEVQPFTLVIWLNHRLWLCRWTGNAKLIEELNASRPHIWCSATLYSPAAKRLREEWFSQFVARHPRPSVADLLRFHLTGGEGLEGEPLCIRRAGGMRTVSVTCISITEAQTQLHYVDLLGQNSQITHLMLQKEVAHA